MQPHWAGASTESFEGLRSDLLHFVATTLNSSLRGLYWTVNLHCSLCGKRYNNNTSADITMCGVGVNYSSVVWVRLSKMFTEICKGHYGPFRHLALCIQYAKQKVMGNSQQLQGQKGHRMSIFVSQFCLMLRQSTLKPLIVC